MTMTVGLRLVLPLTRFAVGCVTVIVTVVMAVSMIVTVLLVGLLRGSVPTEMVVIVPVRGWGNDRFRNATLFVQFGFRRHFVVVLSAASLFMSDKAFERWFVHMA